MTGANALAASGAVRELIEALVVGAREREGANLAIQAMPNPSMFAAAKQAAAETLARLQAAMEAAGDTDVPESLAPLRDAALALATPVEELWREETIVLEGLAGGDRRAAIEAQRRSEPLFQPTEDGMAALVATAHRLADDDPAAFAALGLSRPALMGLAFPDPGEPDTGRDDPLDLDAWLAGFRDTLPEEATDRVAAMWAEAERWQVRAGELRSVRWDLPDGMSAARWSRELDEAQARVTALIGSLAEDEDFHPDGSELPRLPAPDREFVLAADGSGDFTGFEDAVRAIPSGATLRVRPGRYGPGCMIAKSIDIVGDGPVEDIVIDSEFHSVIPVESLGGSLRGVTISNLGGQDRYALWFTDGWFVVEDCVLECEGEAVVHVTGPRAVPRLVNSTLRGAGHGVLVRMGGVALIGSTVTGARDAGVTVEPGAFATVSRSDLSGNSGIGLDLAPTAQAMVRATRIERNGGPGVRAATGSWLRISRCRIGGNAGPDILDLPGSDVENDGEPLEEDTVPFGVAVSAALVAESAMETRWRELQQALATSPDTGTLAEAWPILAAHVALAGTIRESLLSADPPDGLRHLWAETIELASASEQVAARTAEAFRLMIEGDMEAGKDALARTGALHRRCRRCIDAVRFLLAFLRYRSPEAFDGLGLLPTGIEAARLHFWEAALPPGAGADLAPEQASMACGVDAVPIPGALMGRRDRELAPVLAGEAGGAERLYWRVCDVEESEPADALRDEFVEILRRAMRRLLEPEEDGRSLLEKVASAAAGRPPGLSVTSAESTTYAGRRLYPGFSVDLGEPKADNQWYLLTVPEARRIAAIVQAAMGFEGMHTSSLRTAAPHAGYLPMLWLDTFGDDGGDPATDWPEIDDPEFEDAFTGMRFVAGERDAELADWARRAEAFLASAPAG